MNKEKIVLWGTGKIAEQTWNQCKTMDEYEIVCWIDNDANKWGSILYGIEVDSPQRLSTISADVIVILTDYYYEISQQINDMNLPWKDYLIEDKNFFYKRSIMKRYNESKDLEIKDVMEYLRHNRLSVFNYPFIDQYDDIDINVLWDQQCGMYYVYYKKKRMYFSRKLNSPEKVKAYYKSVLIEQDEKSPHKYTDTIFDVQDGDTVLDLGVAEGNFALDNIDKISRIYLFEADSDWVDALKMTFEPFRKKVVIFKKYITSYEEGDFATIDSLVQEKVNFIKMDIEGNEWDALIGARNTIAKSDNLKLAICAYHSDFDQILIENEMDNQNIRHTTSPGYMWFPYLIRQTTISTRLNRGVVRGEKIS